MHGDSAPEDGRRDITSTPWPWMAPEGAPRTPARRQKKRTGEEWLAALRESWGDAYEIRPARRRLLGREWAARHRATGRTLAARDPAALLREMSRDWVAGKARRAHAAEQAAAGARTQAVPVFAMPPAPRPYVRDGEPS